MRRPLTTGPIMVMIWADILPGRRPGRSSVTTRTSTTGRGSDVMARRASGTFEVTITPQETDKAEGSALGRMALDKQFHGDLEATGKGQMLTAGTDVNGSAGYVAIERVTGTLHGRSGSWVLQHAGVMTRGEPRLSTSPWCPTRGPTNWPVSPARLRSRSPTANILMTWSTHSQASPETPDGTDRAGPGSRPGPVRRFSEGSGGGQAGCHWLSTSWLFLLRWMWSWTLATHDVGIRWCRPSGLSFLASLIWSPSTRSTVPIFRPQEA